MDKLTIPKVALPNTSLASFVIHGNNKPSFTPCGVGVMLANRSIIDLNDPTIKPSYSSNEVVGITLETMVNNTFFSLLLPLEAPSRCYWGGWDAKCATLPTYRGINEAFVYENDGEANTLKCIADPTLTTPSRAPMYCHNKILDGKNCYLPAISELRAILLNATLVNTALEICGADKLPADEWFWSSSLADRADAENAESHITYLYGLKYYSGTKTDYEGLAVQGSYYALPIAKLIK